MVEGPIRKRPGTIMTDIVEGVSVTGAYPLLHELDASEIPTPPTPPAIADGTVPISTFADLKGMSGSQSYILTNDIDCTGETWIPIALPFSGTLDGDGYKIHNLSYDGIGGDRRAIFSEIASGFKCKDLTFEDCEIYNADDDIGILFGDMDAGAACEVQLNNLTFTRCGLYSTTDFGETAGIVGGRADSFDQGSHIYDITITDCNILSESWMGGIFGHSQLYSGGGVTGDSYMNNITVTNLEIIGMPSTGMYRTGGAFGTAYGLGNTQADPKIYYYNIDVVGGSIYGNDIDMYAVGGFVGYSDFNSTYVSCTTSMDIEQEDALSSDYFYNIGGFVGDESTYSVYIDCSSTGTITQNPTSTYARYIGGFAGWYDCSADTQVLRCWTSVDINLTNTNSDNRSIGGFVGECSMPSKSADTTKLDLFKRCWSEGDITTNFNAGSLVHIGGFFGRCDDISGFWVQSYGMQDCYTWTQLVYTDNSTQVDVGGFGGHINLSYPKSSWTFDNCYVAQTDVKTGSGYTNQLPKNATDVRGFIGKDQGSGTAVVTNSFWDYNTAGEHLNQASYLGEAAHETCWMMTKQEYEDAGWSFSAVDGVQDDPSEFWYMPAVYECGYTAGVSDLAGYRVIPFVFNIDDSYILFFESDKMGFFRTSGGTSGRIQE
jgi:hypothetical protein